MKTFEDIPVVYGYPAQASQETGIPTSQLRTMVAEGRLHLHHVGFRSFVTAADIERLKKEREAGR